MSPTAAISAPLRHPTPLCADPNPERPWEAPEPPSNSPRVLSTSSLRCAAPLRSARPAVSAPRLCPNPLQADPATEQCWEASQSVTTDLAAL
ncbi:hypothetical protein M422DRAFT_215926 [Sphaerobolus stellatus SS14]|uniref:Uncharacterized protein n=1 Tax=Sphaerobolus stellatus (strain SS14) TaxID=990650 RepID=A0A0C9UDX2_SPHS4|nr:hypothetical protein M422DRAFT_215926 [Sphaerobolus stellatus SS14]